MNKILPNQSKEYVKQLQHWKGGIYTRRKNKDGLLLKKQLTSHNGSKENTDIILKDNLMVFNILY